MEPLIAIIAAMPEEIKPLREIIEGLTIHKYDGFEILEGLIKEKKVLLAVSGVGIDKARAIAATLTNYFPISIMLSIGLAGGLKPSLKIGDVVFADKLFLMAKPKSEHINATELEKKDFIVFEAEKEFKKAAERTGESSKLRFHIGPFVTMDEVVATLHEKRELGEKLNAIAVEMESGAIAQVAYEKGLPFMAIRCIGDSCDDNIDLAIKLLNDIKDKSNLNKLFYAVFKHPKGSLELMKLRKNCTKAINSLTEFILQFLPAISS